MPVNTIATKTLKNSSANYQVSSTAHKIFLIGMMGSGKSYWAEKLKKKLKITAYDLDSLIEMMEEKTVAEIFEEDGEEYFRKAEAKMLRLFAEKKQFILSCGGGTACYHDNMKWMNKNGITIWLDEPVEILTKRLLKEKDHRPLIRNLDDRSLKEFLNRKLQERATFYSEATYRLNEENINEKSFTKILNENA